MHLLGARCMATLLLSKPRRPACVHTRLFKPVHHRCLAQPCSPLLECCLPAPFAPQDLDPTVILSSEVAAFESRMCTGAVITWGSMQIWVVTSAGEGEKTSITGTVTTPACTPNR